MMMNFNLTKVINRGYFTIIGGGNLGQSIASGLLRKNVVTPNDLCISRRRQDLLEPFKKQGVQVTNNNIEAVKKAKYLFLTVEPSQIKGVLQEIGPELNDPEKTVISCVSGVSLEKIRENLEESITYGFDCDINLVRAMPNLAISVNQGVTCLSFEPENKNNINDNQTDRNEIIEIFNNLGKVFTIEEDLMSSATVLGACGTAFAMRYIRAAAQGGIEVGFDSKTSKDIVIQTVIGAAALLQEKSCHPEEGIDQVTTPNGCTIAGLNEMEHCGFSSSLIKGIKASCNKIIKK